MRSLIITSVALALAPVAGCSCGDPVIVYDVFQPDTDPPVDALHTYASHAQVPLRVRSNDTFADINNFAAPVADGAVSLDPDTKVEVVNGVLQFAVLTDGAGEGTLTFNDKTGQPIATRTLTVKEANEMSLAVTAPATKGIVLPAVDVNNVRIYAGGKAAFRTTLRASDEVVGLQAVTPGSLPAGVTTRNGAGCAPDTCDAVRNAFEISVAAGTTAESDVTINAGSATATLHIVPSSDADITDVVLEESDDDTGKGVLVAHVVAGDEPVFGAPVEWTVDTDPLLTDDDQPKPQQGDALQFTPAPKPENPNEQQPVRDITATIAGQTAASSVAGDAFSATSITAACGAVPASMVPLWSTAAILALLRRRRSRRVD